LAQRNGDKNQANNWNYSESSTNASESHGKTTPGFSSGLV
jgi:hypothetical protein